MLVLQRVSLEKGENRFSPGRCFVDQARVRLSALRKHFLHFLVAIVHRKCVR